jgi:hypothetical protein
MKVARINRVQITNVFNGPQVFFIFFNLCQRVKSEINGNYVQAKNKIETIEKRKDSSQIVTVCVCPPFPHPLKKWSLTIDEKDDILFFFYNSLLSLASPLWSERGQLVTLWYARKFVSNE